MAGIKKAARWGGFLLIGALVLTLLAAGGVYFLVSRLDMRAEIARAVENATGRELTIGGNVGVSFWPVLGLEAHNAVLANVEGGRAPSLAAMDVIKIGVEIWPLLRREVVVRKLVMERPQIALELDREGNPNWRLQPRGGRPAPDAPPREPSAPTLREVIVTDGEVSFFDARRNSGWEVTDADFTTALNSLDQPMQLRGAATYNTARMNIELDVQSPRLAMNGQPAPVLLVIESDMVNASFDGRMAPSAGQLDGEVRVSGASLRRLAAWAGAPIENTVGFEQFAVTGRLEIVGGEYRFNNAGFKLDQINGRGDFVLMQHGGKPHISGRLELFDFDANPYLTGVAPPQDTPAPGGEAAPAGAPGAVQTREQIATVEAAPRAVDITEAARETPLDFSGLKAIDAELQITTHKFLFQHMQIDSSQLGVQLYNGNLIVTLESVEMYGGAGHGRLELFASEPEIRILQQLTVDSVDANRFLGDLANIPNIEGRAELSYSVTTQGRTQSELIGAADGRIHIEVVSGALRGVDLGGVARTIRNAMNGDLVQANARTPFQGLSATFVVADGVMASDNFSFNTPELTMPGYAVIDLPQRRLDVRLAPRSPRGGIVVPFAVRGPFGRFDYTSDIRDRARDEIRARVRQVITPSR